MGRPEKANGPETSDFHSLSRNDLLGNILYSGCSAGELLIFGEMFDGDRRDCARGSPSIGRVRG